MTLPYNTFTSYLVQPHIKLHFDNVIGRTSRHLRDVQCQKSDFVRTVFEQIIQDVNSNESIEEFGVLKESLSIYHPEARIGCVLREFQGFPYKQKNKRFILPFFSLVAQDVLNPLHPIILHQVEKKHPGIIGKSILPMLFRTYMMLALEYGIVNEFHGQNVLLEIDQDLKPKRVIIRDFQDCHLDNDFRELLGKPTFPEQLSFSASSWNKHTVSMFRSMLFDFKFTEYLIKPLLDKSIEFSSYQEDDKWAFCRVLLKEVIDSNNLESAYKSYFASNMAFRFPRGKKIWDEKGPILIPHEPSKMRL